MMVNIGLQNTKLFNPFTNKIRILFNSLNNLPYFIQIQEIFEVLSEGCRKGGILWAC
jgi:hypothetical protein